MLTLEEFKEALKVLEDQAIELGADQQMVQSKLSDITNYISESPITRLRKLPIPKEITSEEEKIKWCADNGGHTTVGFCESWSCVRCPLTGWD